MFKYRLYKVPNSSNWSVGIGRKVRESTGTSDYEAAKLYAEALAERLWRQNKLGDRSAIPFGTTAETWLTSDASDKTTDKQILDWLCGRADGNLRDEKTGEAVPNLTNEPLSAVATAPVWDQLRAHGRAKGWALSSIDRMMTTVSSVLNFAHSRGELTEKVSLPKYNPPLAEPEFLTEEQFGRLQLELPAHLKLWSRFAVLTLLRMRAMLGMKWARVDLKRRVAWVPLDDQKNGKTFKFPLSAGAVAVLKEIRAAQAAEYAEYVERCANRYKCKPRPYPEHVFTYRLKPVDDCNGAAYVQACERAGLPASVNWHTLRHTGASWGAQNGVSLEQRMVVGGWTDLRMAMRYTHLEDSHAHAAADVVSQRLHSAVIVKNRRGAKKRAGSRV